MFGLSMRGVSSVTSYAEAVAMFERAQAKPQRPADSGDFKIPGKASKITGISMRNGEVRFTYHTTAVVMWFPDGTCTVDLSYESFSTATFANKFTPAGIGIHGEADVVSVGTWREGKYYAHCGSVTIRPDGTLEGTRAIRSKRLNRKRAATALATENFAAFAAYYTPLHDFWGNQLHMGEDIASHRMLAMMRDPEQWDALARCYLRHSTSVLPRLREMVYELHGAYDTKEKEFAPSYNTMRKWLREERGR